MLKQTKNKLLITSLITAAPIFVGLLLWNRLPEKLVTNWSIHGVPNGWNSKPFAVIAIPLFILAAHLFCVIISSSDPKADNHTPKIQTLVLWICPTISLFCMTAVYAEGLGYHISIEKYLALLLGFLFIVIGNYLPKCKQNYTIGIRVPWTLNSTENWNHTHRAAGRLWTGAGILFLLLFWFGYLYLATALILIISCLPIVYSYWYYKTHEQ